MDKVNLKLKTMACGDYAIFLYDDEIEDSVTYIIKALNEIYNDRIKEGNINTTAMLTGEYFQSIYIDKIEFHISNDWAYTTLTPCNEAGNKYILEVADKLGISI